jgi:predicted Zn-dependent protease
VKVDATGRLKDPARGKRRAWPLAILAIAATFMRLPVAVAADPDEAEIRRGIRLAVDARYAEAHQVFRDLWRQAPENPRLNYYTGLTLLRMGRSAEGVAHLEHSVKNKAPFPEAYLELAQAYRKRNRRAEMLRVVEQGLARFPRNAALIDLSAGADSSPPATERR